ncbi:Integrase [Ruminococcaceae bacterium FB2012]|nr:Integrase [Ruminococcaceae bacterium FB2012]
MANAQKLKSGSWRVRVYDCNTKKYLSVTAATRREANEKAAALMLKLKKNKALKSQQTVGDAVRRYIESRDNIKAPSGIRSYYYMLDKTIDEIKDIPLSKLTEYEIQNWINNNANHYSTKSIENQYGLVRAALKFAKADIDYSMIALPSKKRIERDIPGEKEISIILKMVEGTSVELAVTMAVTLGMRQGEIAGVKWSDYDGQFLHVHAEITLNDKGKYEYQERVKGDASNRYIEIDGVMKKRLDRAEHKSEFISPMLPSSVLRKYHQLCDKNGLPRYRMHDNRHANASQMLINGVPDKYAMKRLGQKTMSMLKDVYQHIYDEKEAEYAKTMSGVFQRMYDTKYDTDI